MPTLTGIDRALGLRQGQVVTVDASGGVVYDGEVEELVQARSTSEDLFSDMPIFRLFSDVLQWVAPLNLVRPSDSSFTPQNCRTYHDITRFIHQKAMEEIFHYAKDIEAVDKISTRLKSDIPLKLNIVCIDPRHARRRSVRDTELMSRPMAAFWSGVKQEGWPRPAPPPDAKGILSVLATTAVDTARQSFSETSFAIVSEEYMLLSLRMGYHFTTVEAVCTDDANKNYIRMQYKDGGAALDRRVRRVTLMSEVLHRMGFEHLTKGDYLDSKVAYLDSETCCYKLGLLGRLNILTKQLDMALSTDEVARWYTDDIMKKLGLTEPGEHHHDSDQPIQ